MGSKISDSKRFKVLSRDLFTCQYCGASAPDVRLEIDHIIPVSKGGSNDSDNLVTACEACNRGKWANELSPYAEAVIKARRIVHDIAEKV